MPLPSTVNQVLVNGTIEHPITGAGATGTVTFRMPYALRTSDGVNIGPLPDTIAPVVAGQFSVTLAATDDTHIVPLNWAYTITVATDAWNETFQAVLPSSPSTTTFAAMVPLSTPPPVSTFVPLTYIGATNGVASLDGTGKVPLAELPTGSGVLSVTAGDGTITIGGTGANPTVAVTRDATAGDIAALGSQAAGATGKVPDAGHVHPMPRLDQVGAPTAAVALNTQKITGLANGTAGQDAAAFGQIPVAGTTSGTYAAGNDSRITGAVPASTVTTKGDLLVATGSAALTRQAVGSNGQALVADSTQTTGIKWAGIAPAPTIRSAWIANASDTSLPNTSGAWQALSGFELDLPSAVGHWVEIGVHGMRSDTSSASIDVAVIVGTSLVRFLSSGTNTPGVEGDPGWYWSTGSFSTQSAGRGFVVTSGDLDGSNVRFVIAIKAAGSGTLYSSTNYPFYWVAKDLGVPN